MKGLTILCLLNTLSGGSGAKAHLVIGVEVCKEKCTLQQACKAVLYDATRLSCNLRFERMKPTVKEGLTFISRDTFKHQMKTCKKSCNFGSCFESHSLKSVCVSKGCTSSPPGVPNSEVAVNNGVEADYTCRLNYSFLTGKPTCHINCSRNSTWGAPQCKCYKTVLTEEDMQENIPLPVPFKPGSKAIFHGVSKGEYFSINLKKGEDILLHINPHYDKRQVWFNTCIRERWGTLKKVKNVHLSKPFSINVHRREKSYQITGGTLKYTFKDRYRKRDPNMIGVYQNLAKLTKMEIK